MSSITIQNLENPAIVMNENFVACKNQQIDSIQRTMYLLINDKVFYTTKIDDVLKFFDEKDEYSNQPISVDDADFMGILLDYTNKLIRSDRLGSRYFMTIKNNEINIKVLMVTICQEKYHDPNLQNKPGIFRP